MDNEKKTKITEQNISYNSLQLFVNLYVINPINMNRILVLSLLLLTGLVGCENSEKNVDKLQIAQNYFEALDESNGFKMKEFLTDSLITSIPEYDYEVRYSKNDYVGKWLKWDSVFTPTYKVLEMNLEGEMVKAKVSKVDRRILFFMQKPFLTNEALRFQNGKIISVETEYLNFDEETWGKNRSELLSYIEKNHTELNGFINDQTEAGAMKFLKALELYENKK